VSRFHRIALAILMISLIPFSLSGCGAAKTSATASNNQVTTVKTGNIKVNITASGNLKLSDKEDLAFEMAGTVAQVLVATGDSVQQGELLATLDTTAWNKQLESLQKALVTAQRNLATRTSSLVKAERLVTTKELALRQAQLDLQTVQNNLTKIADLKPAYDAIDTAKFQLSVAIADQGGAGGLQTVLFWQDRLAKAQDDLKQLLKQYGSTAASSSDAALQVAKGQLQVEQSQMQLGDAQIAIDDARLALANARQDKADAEQAVKDAQSDLDEANALSPTIKAPFDGFVTKVSVAGGQEVKKGTVAVQVADSSKFEADFIVSEMDIYKVGSGSNVTVQLTALPALSLPGRITSISPTATVQSGVVSYAVVADVTPPRFGLPGLPGASGQVRSGQGSQATANQTGQQRFSPGTSGTGGQIGSGEASRATSNQSGQRRFSAGLSGASGQARPGQDTQSMPGLITQNMQLRDGLTVSVSILVEQRNNVLLVANRAITRKGSTTTVTVIKAGITEARTIKIGINDLQNTEVTDGLSEGEQVLIPQSTTSTTATNSTPRPQQFFVPGMGGR